MNDNNNVHVNQIIFLTDRKPNKGEQNVKQILKNVQNANYNKYNILIYTFGITNDNYLDEADGPLIRVSDMFTIKDNNSWVYNAIITNSQPERIYAHGDLQRAKRFFNSLNESKKRLVNSIMTNSIVKLVKHY